MSILTVRNRLRLSQAQLGEKLDVKASMVALLESGKRNPSFGTMKKLIELGATVEEVFDIEYPQKKQTIANDFGDEFKSKVEEVLVELLNSGRLKWILQ